MKNLIITEEERSRILGMHNKAAGKQYLNENPVDPKNTKTLLSDIMNKMASIINSQIDAQIKIDPNFPQTKITVFETPESTSDGRGDVNYTWKYGTQTISPTSPIRANYLLANNGVATVANILRTSFNIQQNQTFPKTLSTLKQPGLQQAINTWGQANSSQPTTTTPTKQPVSKP
jgi:hypothetical protein